MSQTEKRLTTGIPGLDEILSGGLISRRSYMVRGGPGSGKTILGLHFLTSLEEGQKGLFITLGEPEEDIRRNAGILGFDLSRVVFLDLSPASEIFTELRTYDIFSPAEVERDPTTLKIQETIEEVRPDRVFVDGMTQFRHLTPNAFQFRKQILAFLRFMRERGSVALFTSESNEEPDEDLQFLGDGVIELTSNPDGRWIHLVKFRGSDFRSGLHALRITLRGMEIYPRLLPEQYGTEFSPDTIACGVEGLDALLGGGIERGTITLLTGPSGVGKTTVGLQFMKAAAERGERSVVYLFEEWEQTMLRRCEAVGIPVGAMKEAGALKIVQVEPLRFTPDHFAQMVREEVEQRGARIVMVDSIAGYRLSLRGQDLVSRLHALSKYLQNMGVAVLLINEVEAITGDFRVSEVGVSYMADNIVFLRYIEVRGEMCKAIGVLKKRLSDFEKTVRALSITNRGIEVGRKLTDLRGILSGTPEWL